MKKWFLISFVLNLILLVAAAFLLVQTEGFGAIKNALKMGTKPAYSRDFTQYYETRKSIFEAMPNDTNEIIFLGNSITNYCDWGELLGMPNIKNRGINGDDIPGVMKRLDEILESKPQKIFLLIGTNDLWRQRPVEQIVIDYETVVEEIRRKSPETQLYLQSILPTHQNPNRNNLDIMKINESISQIAQKNSLTYIDLFGLYKTPSNELNMAYSIDGLHLNGQGYLLWREVLLEYVKN